MPRQDETAAAFEYQPLPPNQFVRTGSDEEWKYIGLRRTQIEEAIKAGLLEPPLPLNENGRAQGWFGFQLNRYHAAILANTGAWRQRRREVAAEQAALREKKMREKTEQRKARRRDQR
jgi:hypothetical protein